MNCRNTTKPRGQRTRWWGKAAALSALFALGLGANAQVSYSFNFDANSTGWTGNYSRFTGTTACGGSGGAMRRNIFSATVGNLISPSTGTAIGGEITISYDYKVNVWSANNVGAATPWGSFNVQYGASATGPWTTIATVSEEAQTSACIGKSHTFTPPPGAVFIRWTSTYTGGDNYWNFDNIVLSEAAAPPCAGVPNAGTVPTPVTVCSGGTTTMTASGLSVGLGISYQWEESPDGIGSWASVVGGSGATTPSYTTSAIATTRYFRITTTCSTGPDVNSSNVVTVNADPGSFDEDFSSGNLIANCWTPTADANLLYSTSSGFAVGTGSIRWNFFSSSSGTTLNFTSPVLTPVGAGMQVEFDVAGRSYTGGEVDTVHLEVSNNGGSSWTLVQTMTNQVGGLLNTAGSSTSNLTAPTAGEWTSLAYAIPAGTDRVRFRGVSDFGNSVLIDNIAMTAAPTCQAPTAVGVVPTLDGGTVSWTCTSCTGTFIVEYGAPGFTPGTDGTAGMGGTIWTGAPVAGSPIVLTGLSSATAYSVYVREVCAGPDYSPNSTVANFTTSCASFSIPFSEDFSSVTTPALPTCWSTDDVNGPSAPTGFWRTATGAAGFTGAYAQYGYATAIGGNDWLMSPGLDLTGGTTYTITYKYAAQSASFPEQMDVYYGTSPVAAGMTDLIVDHGSFSFTTPSTVSYNITPGSTGVYHIGWHSYSLADEFNINLDDISVVEAPPCPDPTGVSVSGTTYNGTNVNFTCSGCTGSVIVEFGVSPHTPGTDGTAGAGGTLVTGAVSPQAISLSPSTTYQIYVRQDCSLAMDGYSNNTTAVSVTTPAAPPANDLCADAIAVSCNSVTNATTVASTTTGAPTGCSDVLNTAGGIWYTVQGWDGPMTVDLSGSGFDTRVGVFTGSCGALVCVDSDDDDGAGLTSLLTWTGSSSTTYYIYVTGYSTNTGAVTMTVTCGDNNPLCTENGLIMEFQTDGAPNETTWEIRNEAGTVVATSGGPLVAPFGIQTENGCVPDGCYTLRVLDAGGDGMTTGGYILRTQNTNERIIDNRNNFSAGSTSAISGGQGFCLPMSNEKVIFSSCDKLDWITGQYVVATPNAAVSAEWLTGVQTDDGYEFWIFDPNGSYSFRRFRNHATSDGFGPASATRACHMKLNNWAAVSHVPANVLMNVRVRARVNGSNGEFGPACRLAINPTLAACPLTQLMNIPGDPNFSCGATRAWGTGNLVHARPVSGANRYQFRFRIPAEGFSVTRTLTTYFTQLNWAVLPLQDGKTYDVDVRVSKDGGATWCSASDPWGPVCQLTIDNTPAGNGNQNFAGISEAAELRMFPNPNRGDVLNFSISAIEEGVNTVSVDIYDLTGKRMSARTIAVADGNVNTVIDLNGELAAGMYLVNITAGDKTYTERLVIQP
jgi:transposase-like protein